MEDVDGTRTLRLVHEYESLRSGRLCLSPTVLPRQPERPRCQRNGPELIPRHWDLSDGKFLHSQCVEDSLAALQIVNLTETPWKNLDDSNSRNRYNRLHQHEDVCYKPRNEQGPSLTTIKHLAIASFWMSVEDARNHLTPRVRDRRRHTANRTRYCIPSDVRWVLLNKLEGIGQGMKWDDLANDALRHKSDEVEAAPALEDREQFRMEGKPASSREAIEEWKCMDEMWIDEDGEERIMRVKSGRGDGLAND